MSKTKRKPIYVAPLQGLDKGGDAIPRALPWAGMLRPYRALKKHSLVREYNASIKRIVQITVVLFALLLQTAWAALPPLDVKVAEARAFTKGDQLTVTTGAFERTWKWIGTGLATTGIRNLQTGKQWATKTDATSCDWAYPDRISDSTSVVLRSLTAAEADDQGFTSKHLRVVAEVLYPETQTAVRYEIWAYPGAPGVRTQVWMKAVSEKEILRKKKTASTGEVTFKLVRGSSFTPKGSLEVAKPWYCSMALDDKSVELQAMGLDQNAEHMIGVSWWDWGGGGRTQCMRVTSVDGEANETVIKATELPRWKGKEEMPATVLGDLPGNVLMDDTCRIFIDLIKGPNANVSEIFLYEKGSSRQALLATGPRARIEQLVAAAPEGYCLVAYMDLGAASAKTEKKGREVYGRVDFLPVDASDATVRFIGYNNDTQNRNTAATPVLSEEVVQGLATNDWASIVSIEKEGQGLVVVKESHKCANQYGVDTGEFVLTAEGLANTGTSLRPQDITEDKYRWCWATWTMAFEGSDDARELAIKTFDRLRYPIVQERDMWMVMCTWGHSLNPRDGRNYAIEKEVMPEMEICADLGIDMLLIDDGWQVSLESKGANPDGGIGWKPHPSNYPDEWKNVVALKKKLGMRIGLWGVAQSMPVEDMMWNWERVGMNQLKLDFARLGNYNALDEMMQKARSFMIQCEQDCIMSWDTTENAPRYGYYWAREYGNMHFMNRKPGLPKNVTYVPWLALRDFWMLARYQNLNKWQLVIQNPEVIPVSLSDAGEHSVNYCIATALMGTPEFMAVTRFYSEAARNKIRPLLATYKKERADIFSSYVFPIGDQPTNASWTGFQTHRPGGDAGHLILFRELKNKDSEQKIALRFLAGKRIRITNLETGKSRDVKVPQSGKVVFEMDSPASYLLLKYEVQ